MRTLLLLPCVSLLGACYLAVGINRAGPAYDEAGSINKIGILPATMPSEIHGSISDADAKRLKSELPADAAKWLASGITDATDTQVWAHTISEKPGTGYYMTFAISYLDVGDEKLAAETAQQEGVSRTVARGYIYNAASGELVAELRLEKSSSWLGETPHKQDIEAMAAEIGVWFKERRK